MLATLIFHNLCMGVYWRAFCSGRCKNIQLSVAKNTLQSHRQMNIESSLPNRIARILTDIHFWVPVAVLIAGLLLLKLFP